MISETVRIFALFEIVICSTSDASTIKQKTKQSLVPLTAPEAFKKKMLYCILISMQI